MKNVKKGFTLIEIAIVLVVIGLILGMVMKGRSLIDAAQTRSEINKINKLQAAYTTYMSKHNRRPGTLDNSTKAIYDDLLAEGMVSAADFSIPMISAYWIFTGCSSTGTTLWVAETNKGSANTCITISDTEPAATTADAASDPKRASKKFICYVEAMLDDKNADTGQGRGVTATDITTAQYDTCDKLPDTKDASYLFRIY